MPFIFVRNKSFRPYRSPITGEIVTSPKQDREHQKQHDVVNVEEFGSDSGNAYFDRKRRERLNIESSREERKQRLQDVIDARNKLMEKSSREENKQRLQDVIDARNKLMEKL